MFRKRNSTGALTPLAVIILLIIVGLAAFAATYAWQHNRVNSLNNQVNSLDAKLNGLNGQIASLDSQLKNKCPTSPGSSTTTNCASYRYTSPKGVSVLIFEPARNATVSSPIAVIGEIPGNWSNEAQFPVQLKDSGGNVIARATANVLGNWQTSQLVPFSAQLTYTASASGNGTIVLQKDNPSGLAKNADSISIPIRF